MHLVEQKERVKDIIITKDHKNDNNKAKKTQLKKKWEKNTQTKQKTKKKTRYKITLKKAEEM